MRDDSAQRIRLAMDAFISVLLCCVNKRKKPPRAAAPIGVANIVGFSWRPPIQVATSGLPDSPGCMSLSLENARAEGGGKYCRIFRRRADSGGRRMAYPIRLSSGIQIRGPFFRTNQRPLRDCCFL